MAVYGVNCVMAVYVVFTVWWLCMSCWLCDGCVCFVNCVMAVYVVLKMPTIQVFLMDGSSRQLNLVSKDNTTVQQLHVQMMKVRAAFTRTSSLAPGTQADSVQNRPPNIQESINQSATVPQESSSHVPTIALSPRSQSESLIPLILSSPLISVNVLSVFLLLQFGMNYLPLSESQTHWTLLKKRRLKTHLILTSLTTRNV